MSYSYSINEQVIITKNLKNLCRDHSKPVTAHHAIEILWDYYGVFSEPVFVNGVEGVEVFGGPKVAECDGIDGIVRAINPILGYADGDTFTITDENNNSRVVK